MDSVEEVRERVRENERSVSTLRSDVAVLQSEVRALRTQIDNMRAEHAKLPQSVTAIVSLVLTALMFLLNLYVAGVLP